MVAEQFSPREFLRARRPQRFSDSIVEEQPTLDRSLLEYHLDTLTSRSQEVPFEHFARHLAEREICPNLLPQTGPTGGGDSKVDSETYPVADQIALGWYIGIGREAASERWAFAFSAKKKWREKVYSDVAKIVSTGRGYQKAFFVSNQFIPDKARAKVEDALRAKHGLDVRIFDRTWILNKVFENGHELLAIEDLGLTTSIRRAIRRGPLDVQREGELKALEARIQEALQQQRYGLRLVDDCICAAILSRELEKCRTDIAGRFERAERVALTYGTEHERFECAYQRAWTAFWWHEDYEQFAELYGAVEERAKGSRNAYDFERLTNLWFLLHASAERHRLDRGKAAIQARTTTLTKELKRLCEEKHRPSTALQARTLLLMIKLSRRIAAQEPLDGVLRGLQQMVRQDEGLVGYPLDPLIEILTELGQLIDGVNTYQKLFDTIVEVASIRKGEVTAARMWLKRGEQQLDADRPYDAIRSLGRAFMGLYKHESRDDAVKALYLCGCAYERVGLLWAGRGTMLRAASLATDELWRYGKVTLLQAACYGRLKWLELQLGRLPHILAWHELDRVVRRTLADQGYAMARLAEGEQAFDLILGILLLKTDLWELTRLSTLPDVLEHLDLPGASTALMYALGYEEELRDEGFRQAWGEEDLHAIFVKWYNQRALEDLPERPSLYDRTKVTLNSSILGCQITVESANVSPCVELAESLLAALESLLSTGAVERMVAHEPTLTIAVRKSDFAEQLFEFELQERAGRPHINIACSGFDPHSVSLKAQSELRGRLTELLASILGRTVMLKDPEQLLEKLFRDELVLDRAIGFTGSFGTVSNVLGNTPKTRISSWADRQAREYSLQRSESWDANNRHTRKQPTSDAKHPAHLHGQGEPPPELLDWGRTKHTQIQTVSLIRGLLWDEATWCGTAFFVSLSGSSPPTLAPMFKNSEAAKQIFAQWRSELGIRDEAERLRVAIIRAIDTSHPYAYRVTIGANPNVGFSRPDVRYTFFVTRTNTMEAASDLNLGRFLQSYKAFGYYVLAPAAMQNESSEPELIRDYYLIKRELHVREAWEIGRHDVDSTAILEEDSPIIPIEQKNPPVLELLRWKHELLCSSMKSRSRSG